VNVKQPSRWTPGLVVRTTVYLFVVAMLLLLCPDVRGAAVHLASYAVVIMGVFFGGALALLLLLGLKTPRR
jgi:hypothetical protein